MKISSINKRRLYDHFAVIILTASALFFIYRLWSIDIFKVPFTYSSDGLNGLAATKIMIEEGGLGYTSDRLGAPFGFAVYDAAQSTYLPSLLKKFTALFSSNYIFVLNFSYLLGFIIISCVTLEVLKKLGIDHRVAVVLSVLYACVPYHFWRGEMHYALSFYVTVPLAVYYILKIMKGNILCGGGYIKYVFAMAMIGMGGLYYAFFTCFFLCVAAVYILLNEQNIKRLKEIFLSIGIITGTVIIGYMPTVIYSMIHGRNTDGILRNSAALEIYGLKLAQLILPITGHRLSFLAEIKELYNQSYTVNENDAASLGLVLSIGFLVLLLYVWKKETDKNSYLHELACLNLAALIYASAGGLITIQGLFFKMLRTGNRISIFIAFFSCVCIGYLISDFLIRKDFPKKFVCVALLCFLTAGVLDNTKNSYVDAEAIAANVQSDREFVESIEEKENGDGMILQLPIMEFPENGSIKEMEDYAHMAGYLYSDSLRWSYGTFRGREGSDALDEFRSEELTAVEMVSKAAGMGYIGIYIDGLGYDHEYFTNLQTELYSLLQEEPIISMDGHKVYFSIRNYVKKNGIAVDYCGISFGNGIYSEEINRDDHWRWIDQNSQFHIYNWSKNKQKIQLSFTILPSWEGDYSLTIKGIGEKVFDLNPHTINSCILETELEPGMNAFQMHTDAPLLEAEGDPRNLCFMLKSYGIRLMDNHMD